MNEQTYGFGPEIKFIGELEIKDLENIVALLKMLSNEEKKYV